MLPLVHPYPFFSEAGFLLQADFLYCRCGGSLRFFKEGRFGPYRSASGWTVPPSDGANSFAFLHCRHCFRFGVFVVSAL